MHLLFSKFKKKNMTKPSNMKLYAKLKTNIQMEYDSFGFVSKRY